MGSVKAIFRQGAGYVLKKWQLEARGVGGIDLFLLVPNNFCICAAIDFEK